MSAFEDSKSQTLMVWALEDIASNSGSHREAVLGSFVHASVCLLIHSVNIEYPRCSE